MWTTKYDRRRHVCVYMTYNAQIKMVSGGKVTICKWKTCTVPANLKGRSGHCSKESSIQRSHGIPIHKPS